MKATPISMGEIMRDATLHVEFVVTGIRWFKFRLWLGTIFLRLAARTIGCGIEFKGPMDSGYQPIVAGEGDPLPPPRKP